MKQKLICGDFAKEILKIPDNSIDFILADIPWFDDNVLNLDYENIFKELNRVMTEQGLCVITVDTGSSFAAFLTFCFTCRKYFQFCYTTVYLLNNNYGNCIILENRKIDHNINLNKIFNGKGHDLYYYLIESLTKENDTVLDPFMGEGSAAIVCDKLNRNYIGFELNKEKHARAKQNLNN